MKMLSRRLRNVQEEGYQTKVTSLAEHEVATTLHQDESSSDEGLDTASIVQRMLVLQKVEIFSYLTMEDFMRLAQVADEKQYDQGAVICRADDYGDTMYGILSGSVKVHKGDEQYALLQAGEAFGEMAIIDRGPRLADCAALEPTHLLHIHRDHIVTLCFQNINVLRSMLRVLAERLIAAEK